MISRGSGNGKHVLLLGSYPPPYGGISSHLLRLTQHLAECGFRVQVISPGDAATVEDHEGVRVFRMGRSRGENFSRGLRQFIPMTVANRDVAFRHMEYLKALAIVDVAERAFREDGLPDLISAYHLTPWGLAALMLRRRHGIPYVLTNFGEIYATPGFYAAYRGVVQAITREAALVLATSEHCASSYSEIGLPLRSRVVFYGADLEDAKVSGTHAESRDRVGVPRDAYHVLFFGRLIRDMGLDTVLQSAPGFLGADSRIFLSIAGAAGELEGEARALAEAWPGRVKVTANVPHSEVRYYYHSADAVLAPTKDRRACMGLSIKEAMAASRPVIAARVGGVPEAVRDGETGLLVPAQDPVALGAAVLRLAAAPEIGRAYGQAGYERCFKEFDIETTHERLTQLFLEVIRR